MADRRAERQMTPGPSTPSAGSPGVGAVVGTFARETSAPKTGDFIHIDGSSELRMVRVTTPRGSRQRPGSESSVGVEAAAKGARQREVASAGRSADRGGGQAKPDRVRLTGGRCQ